MLDRDTRPLDYWINLIRPTLGDHINVYTVCHCLYIPEASNMATLLGGEEKVTGVKQHSIVDDFMYGSNVAGSHIYVRLGMYVQCRPTPVLT